MIVHSDELVRTTRPDEYDALLELLDVAYGNAHSVAETKKQLSSKYFDPNDCLVTRQNDILTSSVAITKLPKPRWYVLRYLALREAKNNIHLGKQLVETAVKHVKSKNAEYLRSTTPRIEPYTTIYEEEGFRPVRRDFRIHWTIPEPNISQAKISLLEVTNKTIDQATHVWMDSIRDIWAWRTIEQGGEIQVARRFKEEFEHGQKWMLALDKDNHVVGLTGLLLNDSGVGKARFRGAYVLPEHRGKGYGMAIMQSTFQWARILAQNEMVIYTFSYLERLAPGATLYVKSGGKIESEYLQLEKPLN